MSCCTTHQLTVYDCFDRGRNTASAPPLAIQGQAIFLPHGLYARFSLSTEAGKSADGCEVTQLRFQATSCTTLIACCQALVELNRGATPEQMAIFSAPQLLRRLGGVPAAKQDRALLAVTALRAALSALPQQTVAVSLAIA